MNLLILLVKILKSVCRFSGAKRVDVSISHLFFCILLHTARTRSLKTTFPKLYCLLTSESPDKGRAGQRLEDRWKRGVVSLLQDLAVTTLVPEAVAGETAMMDAATGNHRSLQSWQWSLQLRQWL